MILRELLGLGVSMLLSFALYCVFCLSPTPLVEKATLVAWLDETARRESRGNRWSVGDRGRSRGAYQIQRATWAKYSTTPWRVGAHDPVESRRVCREILLDCAGECARRGKPVTFENVRWFYQHGGWTKGMPCPTSETKQAKPQTTRTSES